MKTYNQPIELIIKAQKKAVVGKSAPFDVIKKLKKYGINAEILSSPKSAISISGKGKKSKSKNESSISIKTNANDTEINPWDFAHRSYAILKDDSYYIEPNFFSEFVVSKKLYSNEESSLTQKSFGGNEPDRNFDSDWEPKKNLIWHLADTHSQLLSARKSVEDIDYKIRIGHLDTGYSKTHFVIDDSIRKNKLQRNFVTGPGELADKAVDAGTKGFLKQPGHGTGTLGILAGTKIKLETDNGVFDDYLGGAHFADIVCCRISESVVLIKTRAFAEAIEYLTELSLAGEQVHVVSMSMGGAPSKIWADAVNAAYEAGITLVTAAGNNFSGLPIRKLIYPARFQRVISACGVTYNFTPYLTSKANEMQGCFGPEKYMSKALSAFTPNTPWTFLNKDGKDDIQFSGAGTSSATPQIAAAAAIYYRKYHESLDKLLPWQRVEAIRNALYKSALKTVKDNKYNNDFTTYFGNGILQANDALKIPVGANFVKTPEDRVPLFPLLGTIFKAKTANSESAEIDMFNTEIAQLLYNYPELNSIVDESIEIEKMNKTTQKKLKDAIISHPATSATLSNFLSNNK